MIEKNSVPGCFPITVAKQEPFDHRQLLEEHGSMCIRQCCSVVPIVVKSPGSHHFSTPHPSCGMHSLGRELRNSNAALDLELDKSKEIVVIHILYLKDEEVKTQRRRNDGMEAILWIFLEQK